LCAPLIFNFHSYGYNSNAFQVYGNEEIILGLLKREAMQKSTNHLKRDCALLAVDVKVTDDSRIVT
jgi:hypothetical protein